MNAIIEMKGVSKSYRRGAEELHVLTRLDLTLPAGDFVAMMGPSGSGKSTILNLVGGLDTPDEGTIIVAGTDLRQKSKPELSRWRARHIGFVFQSFNLVPVLTAYENVLLPLLLTPLSAHERREHAEYALEVVGLSDWMKHRPGQLSGGQEQRVAIARAISTDPDVLLADEPTGDLDRSTANDVMDLLYRLNSEMEKTILMVTHDPICAERAQRTLYLDKGELEDRDPVKGLAS